MVDVFFAEDVVFLDDEVVFFEDVVFFDVVPVFFEDVFLDEVDVFFFFLESDSVSDSLSPNRPIAREAIPPSPPEDEDSSSSSSFPPNRLPSNPPSSPPEAEEEADDDPPSSPPRRLVTFVLPSTPLSSPASPLPLSSSSFLLFPSNVRSSGASCAKIFVI